nr:hypothetical protein L203_02498 [Cryptococcus depauperatus CBS 7841]
MGLLSRLRHRTSTAAGEQSFSLTVDSTTHLPSTTPSSPGFTPLSPTTSIASRIARRPWKREKHDGTNVQKISGRKSKEEGKTLDKPIVVGGPRYDDLDIPPLPPHWLSKVEPARGSASAIASSTKDGSQEQLQKQLQNTTSQSHLAASIEDSDSAEHQRTHGDRSSGESSMQGGLLGQLSFETGHIRERKASGSSWLQDIGELMRPAKSSVQNTPSQGCNVYIVAPSTPEDDSLVIINSQDVTPENKNEDLQQTGTTITEEEIEVLESAEKKYKFWKSGKKERHSKATDDLIPFDRSEPPTPNGLTSSSATGDLTSLATPPNAALTRPQQSRRPSSSILFNRLSRTVPRTASKSPEMDEEGSFQLTGFRHISGMSDVGDLEGYLTHVKRESVVALGHDQPAVLNDDGRKSPTALPTSQSLQSLTRPIRPIPLSRPSSMAHSLTSVDDVLNSPNPNRVSVAAFKKGLRRPSAPIVSTHSDIGHEMCLDEDDDDIPLGVRRASQTMCDRLSKQKSTLSLSSMRGLSLDDIGKDRQSLLALAPKSTERDLILHQGRLNNSSSPHNKDNNKTSSGFVVKNRRPTSPESDPTRSPPQSQIPVVSQSSGLGLPVYASSTSNHIPSSDLAAMKQQKLSQPSSPPVENPIEGSYFPRFVATQTPMPSTSQSVYVHQFKSRLDSGDSPSPSSLSIAKPLPGAQTHLNGNQPPNANDRALPPLQHSAELSPTLTCINLPLPPDLMPDTPPKPPLETQSRQAMNDSNFAALPVTQKKRKSLLEEPIKYLSGLWGSQSSGEDGFDPVLAANSLRILGGDEVESPTKMTYDEGVLGGHNHVSPDHQASTLGAARIGIESFRSPLSERLAGVATSAPRTQKSTFKRLKTDDNLPLATTGDLESSTTTSDSTPVSRQPPSGSILIPNKVTHGQKTSSKQHSGIETKDQADVSKRCQISETTTSLSHQSTRRALGDHQRPICQNRAVSSPIAATQTKNASMSGWLQEGGSEDDDEPLQNVKHRSSVSSTITAPRKMPVWPSSFPTPPTSVATASNKSTSSPQRRKPLIDLRPSVSPPPKTMYNHLSDTRSSISSRKTEISSTASSTSTSTSGRTSLPSPTRMQVKFGNPEKKNLQLRSIISTQNRDALDRNSVSIVNGLATSKTGNSRESNNDQRRQSEGTMRHSSPYDPPVQARMLMQEHQTMSDMQSMSSEEYLTWQKQQWQMQYMAAAYRVSEEEWERQRLVSTSISTHNTSVPFAPFPMPPFSMFPQHVLTMGNGMPLNYGFPQTTGYPYFPGMFHPFSSMGQRIQSDTGGGGEACYSYGTGTQSAFGDEFGPPSAMPSQQRFFARSEALRSSGMEAGAMQWKTQGRATEETWNKQDSTPVIGVREVISSSPVLNQKSSGVFRGLLAERERIELHESMEKQAQKRLEKSRQGKEMERYPGSPPSSWTRKSVEWSDDFSTPRTSNRTKSQIVS